MDKILGVRQVSGRGLESRKTLCITSEKSHAQGR